MTRRKRALSVAARVEPYFFLGPAFLIMGIFVIFPALKLFYLSLCKASILGRSRFIGLDNFFALTESGDFHTSVAATLIFMISVVLVQTGIALAVALLVEGESKAMGSLRTLFFVPVVMPFVVVAYLWKFLYNPDFGLINAVLDALRLPREAFLASPTQALPSLMVASIWKSWAFFMMIFIAGIKEIPKELSECAYLEGATAWQRMLYITIPLLKRTILFVIVVTTMDSVVKVFTPVFVMTDGGPRGSTDLLVYYIWRTAFRLGQIGYASAIAVFMFGFVLLVNLAQLRIGRDQDE
jgi:multiple sugar transport system permease protein